MAEYIERIEALEITTRTCGDYAAAWSEIRKLPAADVAPVVRCKDCKHYIGLAECEFEGHFSGGTNYFCADGERKTT